jgi:hypothetical protein
VVEEILAAGFVGQEEEGKALAADKIAASCRQNLVLSTLVHKLTLNYRYTTISARLLR